MARLEALENDNAGIETVEMNDDDEASLDDDDQGFFFPPFILSLFFLCGRVWNFIYLGQKGIDHLKLIISHA